MQEVGPDGPDIGALGFLVGVGPVGLIGAGVDGLSSQVLQLSLHTSLAGP